MRSWVIGASLAALAAGSAVAQGVAPAAAVAERREGLRRVGQHMEAMQVIAQGRGDPREAVPRIEEMRAFFGQGFVGRFPAGTQQGAPGIETRALPAIWNDWAGFNRAAEGINGALANLQVAAASGDRGAFGSAFQATGGACGNCHRPFRAPAR